MALSDEQATRYAVVRYYDDGTLFAEKFSSLLSEAEIFAENWKRSAVQKIVVGVRHDGYEIWKALKFTRGKWPPAPTSASSEEG